MTRRIEPPEADDSTYIMCVVMAPLGVVTVMRHRMATRRAAVPMMAVDGAVAIRSGDSLADVSIKAMNGVTDSAVEIDSMGVG
eukprot:3157446-Pleurochrysis_carterae.AAC.1